METITLEKAFIEATKKVKLVVKLSLAELLSYFGIRSILKPVANKPFYYTVDTNCIERQQDRTLLVCIYSYAMYRLWLMAEDRRTRKLFNDAHGVSQSILFLSIVNDEFIQKITFDFTMLSAQLEQYYQHILPTFTYEDLLGAQYGLNYTFVETLKQENNVRPSTLITMIYDQVFANEESVRLNSNMALDPVFTPTRQALVYNTDPKMRLHDDNMSHTIITLGEFESSNVFTTYKCPESLLYRYYPKNPTNILTVNDMPKNDETKYYYTVSIIQEDIIPEISTMRMMYTDSFVDAKTYARFYNSSIVRAIEKTKFNSYRGLEIPISTFHFIIQIINIQSVAERLGVDYITTVINNVVHLYVLSDVCYHNVLNNYNNFKVYRQLDVLRKSK